MMSKAVALLVFAWFTCISASAQDYWPDSDMPYPIAPGVRKIIAKTTDNQRGQPSMHREVLFFNKKGFVERVDIYEPAGWFSGARLYDYADTLLRAMYEYGYHGNIIANAAAAPENDSIVLIYSKEWNRFVNGKNEWRDYRYSPEKSLRYIQTDYSSGGGKIVTVVGQELRDGKLPEEYDSTRTQYGGDTATTTVYRISSRYRYDVSAPRVSDITVFRRNTKGQLLSAERIYSQYGGMSGKTSFHYDQSGRYTGYSSDNECDEGENGRCRSGQQRFYDARGRVVEVRSTHNGKTVLKYEYQIID